MPGPRVLFLTSGVNVPSTRYRILPYLARLQRLGVTCDVAHSYPEKYQKIDWLGWRASHLLRGVIRRVNLWKARRTHYDVIVLEREIFDDPTWHLEAAFRRVTNRFVLDVDDAIFLRYPEKFAKIAGMVDHILAGNRLLAEECRKHCEHVTVIPTAIDLNDYMFDAARVPNPVPVVGWIGTPANLPYLKIALPALERLALERQFILRIITSDAAAVQALPFRNVQVEFRKWSAMTATSEVRHFDLGIMPLPNEEWERYKCGFKLLQYMACSLPAIASPVGVNREIITHGVNGLLAESEQDWFEALNRILDQPQTAQSMGVEARMRIERHYSIDVQLPRLYSALLG
ncbi:glycosyltransferase family 4 protein [Planctomicrobium sp. SH661]|uniref:glycosyltransferase family 4 protein n=1 Tax=Planctomicrobium sp. SH661 TaxID=3448124 RepID=UPI003F5BEA32